MTEQLHIKGARLSWKGNTNLPLVYAEITNYLWLHVEPETGKWWISKSADSTRCAQYCITFGHVMPIRDEHTVVAAEQQASNELHRIADSFSHR